MIKSLFKTIITLASLCFFFSKPSHAVPQNNASHTQIDVFKTTQISVDKFDWELNKETNQADANISVTNHATLDIRSVSISLTAQDKNGVMLQSETQTLKKSTSNSIIPVKEQKSITFKNVFHNPSIYNMILKQVTIEYINGAIEILN
jgi:hypothetical protein